MSCLADVSAVGLAGAGAGAPGVAGAMVAGLALTAAPGWPGMAAAPPPALAAREAAVVSGMKAPGGILSFDTCRMMPLTTTHTESPSLAIAAFDAESCCVDEAAFAESCCFDDAAFTESCCFAVV